MNKTDTNTSGVYTPELIDLVRLGVAFLGLLEQRESQHKVIDKLLQLLPRIYAQTLLLPEYFYDWEEELLEEYVREESYEAVRSQLAETLGQADAFLVPLIEDGVYRSDCTQLTISECVADIYQHLGNLLGIIRSENTAAVPPAIGRYLLYFEEYWGRQLLVALPALNEARRMLRVQDEEEEESTVESEEIDLYNALDDYDNDDL
ncbi:MAG: DUF5063 domain-containing protein [Porphyromonadaceae bacterium]|nr:DUF5063 domain-containing protein [Porphyromonadaceae bacterium]